MSLKKRLVYRKALSGFLGVAFFIANGVLAYATETNFWSSRRMASQRMRGEGATSVGANGQTLLAHLPQAGPLDLSHSAPSPKSLDTVNVPFSIGPKTGDWLGKLVSPYGTVNGVYLSPKKDAPFIVHIQDAHGIEEAQRNISSMIGLLAQEPGINLVGVEGASGPFSLDPYRDYPDPTITKDIADLFLKKGLIAGPEYAGLTLPKSLNFFGTENDALYKSNVVALKTSYQKKDNALALYATLRKEAATLKKNRFSIDLQTFDRHFEAYHSDNEKLAPYVRYLVGQPVSPKTPHLQLLVKALNEEEALDFKRVELERKIMVENLANKLSAAELQDLVAKSVDYRAGRMGYGGYHAHLRRVCVDHGLKLEDTPQLSRYISYVLLADKIDRGELLHEMDVLEKVLPETMAKTDEEKKLVALSFDLTLTGKLLRHEMSTADWTAYAKRGEEIHRIAARLAELAPSLADLPGLTAETLKPYEDFCSFASQRNNAMADNLLTQMGPTNGASAILVAGGFHTEGLSALLRERHVSFVVVTPKITEVPKENNYLDVLAKDPAPIEQQLAGERIYLSKPIGMAVADVQRAIIAFQRVAQGKSPNENYTESGAIARVPSGKNPFPIKIGTQNFYLVENPPRGAFARRWLSQAKKIMATRAPVTEIPGLPGAALALGGSGTSIGSVSVLFALLHHLRPPPNASRDFNEARGIGKLAVSSKIVAATLWGTIAQFFKPEAWRIISVSEGKQVFNPGVAQKTQPGNSATFLASPSSSGRLTLNDTYHLGRRLTFRLFGRAWSDRAIENWFAMFYEAFRILSPSRFSSDHPYNTKIEKALRDIGIGAMVLAGLAVFYFGFGTGLDWLLSDSRFSFAPAVVIAASGSFLLGFTATVPVHGLLNIVANTLNAILNNINKTFRIPRLTFQDNRETYGDKNANGNANLDGWISILVNAYQGGHLSYFNDQLPLPQEEIEHEFEKIAQDVVLKKISDISMIVPFKEIPAGYGATMIAYENPLLPNIIIKMAKPTRVGGFPIDFEKEVLPGYRVAKNRLGGLFAMMVLNNKNYKFPLFIGRGEVKVDYLIIQERLTPVNRVLASIENESDRLRAESHYLEKIHGLLEEFNKRGVVEMDASPSSLLVNFGLNSHNALTGLDVDGIMTFEEYSAYLDKHGDENGERDKLAKMEKIHAIAVKQGIEPSRVRDIFLDDVQKAQMEYLKGIYNSQEVADLEYVVEEITLPTLSWGWWNEAVVTAVYWLLGSRGVTWEKARRQAQEKVTSPGFKWKWAPLTELPFLPGASVWGGVSSTLGIVGLSAIFSLFHNLSPPEDASERFARASGFWGKARVAFAIAVGTMGRTLGQFAHLDAWKIIFPKEAEKPRIVLGVGVQFLIRTFVAFWINTWALQFGVFLGDSTLATFVAAYLMHAVYNFLAPYISLPTLNALPKKTLHQELDEVRTLLEKVKPNFEINQEEPLAIPTDKQLASDVIAIDKFLIAMNTLRAFLANIQSRSREEVEIARGVFQTIERNHLFPNATQISDLLRRIASAGNYGLAFTYLDQLMDLQSRWSPDDYATFKKTQVEIQIIAIKLKAEKNISGKPSAKSLLDEQVPLRLTKEQIVWLKAYIVFENNKLLPSFQLMSVVDKKDPLYFKRIWEGGLGELLSGHWNGSVNDLETDLDVKAEINSEFSKMLASFKSRVEFLDLFPNISDVNDYIADEIKRPRKLVDLINTMNQKQLVKALTEYYDAEPKAIEVTDTDGVTYKVLAHPAPYGQKNLEINPKIIEGLAKKVLMGRRNKNRGGDHAQNGIQKLDWSQEIWAFARVSGGAIIFYLFVTAQKAHGTTSTEASNDVNEEVIKRFNKIESGEERTVPFVSRGTELLVGFPPATIPAVASLIRVVMEGIVRVFPSSGVARRWGQKTEQEKLDRIIRVYAPLVESSIMSLSYWGIRAVLTALGGDLTLSDDFGLLSLLNVAFGLFHTRVYQRNVAGEWVWSEKTSLATRLSIAVNGIAMHSPLLFSALSPLLAPVALVVGNMAAAGLSVVIHRMSNSIESASGWMAVARNVATTAVVSTEFAVVVAPLVIANFSVPLNAFFFVSLVSQFLDPETFHALIQNPVSGMANLIFGTATNFSTYLFGLGVPAMLAVGAAGGLVAAVFIRKFQVPDLGFKKWVAAMALAIGVAMNPANATLQRVQEPVVATQVQPNSQPNLDMLAMRAALTNLTDQMPTGSVLTGLIGPKLNVPGYHASADFSGVPRGEIQQAITILNQTGTEAIPGTKERAVSRFAEEVAALDAGARITVGLVAMTEDDKKTALAAVRGMLKVNQRMLFLSDNPDGILKELGVTDGDALLIKVVQARPGISMKEVVERYGKNEIPLSSIVFASEGAVDVSGTKFHLITFQSIAVSVRNAIDQLIAVLQAA